MSEIVNQNGTNCCKDPAALNYFYGSCQNVCLDNSCCVYTEQKTQNKTTKVSSFNFNFDVVAGIIDMAANKMNKKI
jgi:hypothetical protein